MSEYTSNLQLFKYDTATDGKEVFSINASMNDNWDKIDAFAAGIKSLSNLDEQGEKRFTDINAELNKKLEADVLLAENGYIKFNNGLIIQYGNYNTRTGNTWIPITFPINFTHVTYCVCAIQRNDTNIASFPNICVVGCRNRTHTNMEIGFRYAIDTTPAYMCWMVLGY